MAPARPCRTMPPLSLLPEILRCGRTGCPSARRLCGQPSLQSAGHTQFFCLRVSGAIPLRRCRVGSLSCVCGAVRRGGALPCRAWLAESRRPGALVSMRGGYLSMCGRSKTPPLERGKQGGVTCRYGRARTCRCRWHPARVPAGSRPSARQSCHWPRGRYPPPLRRARRVCPGCARAASPGHHRPAHA